MNNSIRNGIVFENILQHVDVQAAMKLSAACMRWYEQINNDTKLWNRLVQLEQIEDPEYWYRVDDNDQWTLGTPCKPKNILLNYRRTCYCIKHNIYKKYEFKCDNNIKYDGKTLLFTLDNELHIYKIINNSLQLFQKIDLSVHYVNDLVQLYTNNEFIVINKGRIFNDMISYRLMGNKYVFHNKRPYDEFRNWTSTEYGKLLDSNVFISTRDELINSENIIFFLFAWNVLENKIIFNAPNYKFIKHDKGIVYAHDIEAKKLVLFNENFEVIYRVNETFDQSISYVIVNDKLLYVIYRIENDLFGISSWDKDSGQIKIGSKCFQNCNGNLKVFPINRNIIVIRDCTNENLVRTECYDDRLQLLCSHTLQPDNRIIKNFYFIFNKLLAVKESTLSRQCFIEFRNVYNGNVLFTTKVLQNFWNFKKDMMRFSPYEWFRTKNTRCNNTVLLYR